MGRRKEARENLPFPEWTLTQGATLLFENIDGENICRQAYRGLPSLNREENNRLREELIQKQLLNYPFVQYLVTPLTEWNKNRFPLHQDFPIIASAISALLYQNGSDGQEMFRSPEADAWFANHISGALIEKLRRRASVLIKNSLTAEDIVQDALLKAFRFRSSFQQGTNFDAWIFRILNNTVLNYARSTKSNPLRGTSNLTSNEGLLHSARLRSVEGDLLVAPSAEEEVLNRALDPKLEKVLNELDPRFREVLILLGTGNMSYQEIAKYLNVPLGTVMSRISRARQIVKALLQQEGAFQ